MHAMVAKMKGDRMNTFMHMGDLLAVFRKYVQTDFTDSELLSIAAYFQGLPDTAIVNAQVPYTGDEDLPTYGDSLIPDTAARDKLVQAMLLAPPVAEPSPDAMALAAIPAATLRVDVENGSGVPGAAAAVANRLRKAGFNVGSVGNADRSDYTTTEIHEHSTVTFAGAKVRAALPVSVAHAEVVPDPSPAASPDAQSSPTTSDVTLIVGSDLAKAVVAVAAAAP
jgi:LytR cell envelope-related transcriptional attenuator